MSALLFASFFVSPSFSSTATSLTVDFSPDSIAAGAVRESDMQYATVTAQLTSNGASINGETILLYYKVDLSGSWTAFYGDTTDSQGRISKTFYPDKYGIPAGTTVYFKAVFIGSSSYGASNAETADGLILTQWLPPASALTVNFSPDTIAAGAVKSSDREYATVTAHLTLNGDPLYSRTVKLYYKVDSADWQLFFSELTDSNGFISRNFYPDMVGVAGGTVVYFKANYTGTNIVGSSEAQTPTGLIVTQWMPPASSLSINFSPSTITTGFAASSDWQHATIVAQLTLDDSPLHDRSVSVYYKVGSTGNWQLLANLNTDDDGKINADFCPDSLGICGNTLVFFKATYSGTNIVGASEAETTTGLILTSSIFVAPEYPLGILLALIANFAALAIFSKTKQHFKPK
ncbi:MAG: hypothetical protein NWE92_05765 [Candidatus Bathyarchaeota archaeon]|nr:hypothetical protein [Candidatus Bathyarchaeota archaeon]